MTNHDIESTLALMQRLFVKRFSPDHLDALRLQIERYPLDATQAAIVLKQTWATEGKFCNPGKMLKALRRAAYGDDEKQTAKQRDKAAEREALAALEAQTAIDDAATVRWVATLDQDDIDELVQHVVSTCGPWGAALLRLAGRDSLHDGKSKVVKLRREHLEKHPAIRSLLHAASRQLLAAIAD